MAVVTREQVLKLLQQGKSTDEIQALTKASKGAVKVHIRRLKDTGRWSELVEPQICEPEPKQAELKQVEPKQEQGTKISDVSIIFKSKDEVIDFLVARLQESKMVCDTEKMIRQKDYEISRLTERVDVLQAELTRLKSSINALRT